MSGTSSSIPPPVRRPPSGLTDSPSARRCTSCSDPMPPHPSTSNTCQCIDQPELLVLLVSGKGEGHLLPDFGRPFVREDPQDRHPFLESLGHEQAHEHLLAN